MKTKKLITLLLISLGVAIILGAILRENDYDWDQTIQISLLSGLLIFLTGMVFEKRRGNMEGFDVTGKCNQTINIYQNCGDSSGPPTPTPVNSENIKAWVNSVRPDLTDTCKQCVLDKIISMKWSDKILEEEKLKDISLQKSDIDVILAVDCVNQCTAPPANLDRELVKDWVVNTLGHSPMHIVLAEPCVSCIVDAIMRIWSIKEFQDAQALPKDQQLKVIQALRALNCQNCQPSSKLNPEVVREKLINILAGRLPQCFDCVVNSVINIWTLTDWNLFLALNPKDETSGEAFNSQSQVIQALIAFNCATECSKIPSGISDEEAQLFVQEAMPEMVAWGPDCVGCLISKVKEWPRNKFEEEKIKDKSQKQGLLVAIAAAECSLACQGPEPENASGYYEPCCGAN